MKYIINITTTVLLLPGSRPANTYRQGNDSIGPKRLFPLLPLTHIFHFYLSDLVPQTLQPQKGETTTPHIVMNVSRRTGRRGEIIVTTQRAVQRPRMMGVPTSSPSKKPTAETPLCTKAGGACEYLGSNKTLLNWDDLQRTLSFAWDMHVYGSGTLFALLAVIALVNLIGSPIVCVPYLPYIITSNALLFVIGILRSVFFLLDPYATKSKISHGLALVLYNITFPLMLSTFAILVLLVMKIASLQLLPPKLQTLPLLGFIGVIHFIVLLSADLLTHLLNPSVNIVLQILSISWGIFLMVGNFVAYYRLRGKRNMRCLFTSSRVLLVSSFFGLLCCGLQVYAVLWLYGLLGKKNEFTWSWWFLQFWFRIFELGLCFSLLFVASHSFCQQCSSSDHTCWSKIISYFCTYKKAEVAEYPNNCYDWTNSIQERVVNNNISKSLIRNEPENVPLKIPASPLFKPRPDVIFGPKSQNMIIGRSYTSICFEKESMLSLTDLEFRPPSPINLSRSIDEALFREHLVRDSIFLDSSLQYPNLKMRRCSNPDYMYTLARSSSMTEVDSPSEDLQQSKDLPRDITTENVVSGSSMDSVSKGSIKISWNPWRHGLSSVESLPLEEAPSTQLLKQGSQPSIRSKGSEPEKTFGKRFIERSQTTDSNSLASDTIEL
uniref:Proline-rich transmembrane protein 3/4 domain-containing protein n=1 Tax=Xenopus tropicalis TaxID=8364 RepID=A0A803J8K7_XENTR